MELSFSIFGIFFVIVAVMMLVAVLFHFGVMALIFKKAYDASQGGKSAPGTPEPKSDPRCPNCGASEPETVGAAVLCRYCGSRYKLD